LPDGLLVDFNARLLEELNPYSIEGRYPGVWEPVEQEEALRAVEAARTIRQAIRRILSPYLHRLICADSYCDDARHVGVITSATLLFFLPLPTA
jgi:hypothetical protein